jgi:deazaflavin-dependent oxidoreductase (nitroreductase family)
MGISVYGSRVLAVKGRKSGEWRTTPVNPLRVDGVRYLVAPRGNTQWVRNLRVVGTGELRVGAKTEPFTGPGGEAARDRPRLPHLPHRAAQQVRANFGGYRVLRPEHALAVSN